MPVILIVNGRRETIFIYLPKAAPAPVRGDARREMVEHIARVPCQAENRRADALMRHVAHAKGVSGADHTVIPITNRVAGVGVTERTLLRPLEALNQLRIGR